jgi:hypothetical protein
MLTQMECAYNATRALGIEHAALEANFDLLFDMRPSIPVSQDATKWLKLLHELHALIRSV